MFLYSRVLLSSFLESSKQLVCFAVRMKRSHFLTLCSHEIRKIPDHLPYQKLGAVLVKSLVILGTEASLELFWEDKLWILKQIWKFPQMYVQVLQN